MTTQTDSKQPTHRIYVVSGDGDTARWTQIGAAFIHKSDGKGYNLALEALPIIPGSRIVMREIQPKEADNQGALS